MIKIIVTALTPIGEEALNKQIDELAKLKPHVRAQKKLLGIYNEVVNGDPLTFVTEIRGNASKLTRPEHLKNEVIASLNDEGAKENIDFGVFIQND